ncbi:hypothetical protein EIP86_004097 [Pleurotus ostreatoroseus]|nr:hypothetical protein EIP86_004097 [Pleurotus ostreatoroseus]
MLRYEDEEGAGPSNPAPTFDDEMDSGSDFTPEATEAHEEQDEFDGEEDELSEEEPAEIDREESVISMRAAKAPKNVGRRNVALTSGISMASISLPSLHHRHRAIPLHQRTGQVERLKSAPKLFSQPEVVPTHAWSASETVIGRVNKSWGFNVGPGPLWEVLEDRAWFKEITDVENESEAARRPKVYQQVRSSDAYKVLSRE